MSNVSPVHGPRITPLTQDKAGDRPSAAAPGSTPRAQDRADISSIARYRSKIADLPDIRQELVDRVRAEIGPDPDSYLTDARIEQSLDGLAQDLA